MNQIKPLSDDNPLQYEILPSVWMGYRGDFNKFKDDQLSSFISQVLQTGRDVPKEKADAISGDFFNASLHDFCVKHLDRSLKQEDHQKILIKAQEIIKSNQIKPVDKKDDLISLLANKVALNAHDVSNHMLSNACFLADYNALPSTGEEVLKRATSPVFYEDHNFFNQTEKELRQRTNGAPADRVYQAFNRWFMQRGFKCIVPFKQYNGLIRDMRNFNALIVNRAILDYQLKERHPYTIRRMRPINPSWRGARQ